MFLLKFIIIVLFHFSPLVLQNVVVYGFFVDNSVETGLRNGMGRVYGRESMKMYV